MHIVILESRLRETAHPNAGLRVSFLHRARLLRLISRCRQILCSSLNFTLSLLHPGISSLEFVLLFRVGGCKMEHAPEHHKDHKAAEAQSDDERHYTRKTDVGRFVSEIRIRALQRAALRLHWFRRLHVQAPRALPSVDRMPQKPAAISGIE